MKKQREVSQFIIVAPLSRLEEITRSRERLTEHLSRRFPHYSFEVASLAPIQDDEEFCVIPIMNFKSPDGDTFMCSPAPSWVFAEIAMACRQFDGRNLRLAS